jgi:hypothetical protein
MSKLVSALILGLLLAIQSATVRGAESLTSEELASWNVRRRAVDTVIWGLPLVGEDVVKQAYFPRWQGELQQHRLVAQRRRLEEPVSHA